MKKLLLSNGRPVIKNGKVVLTENAEDCSCCDPDCKYLYPICEETGERPVIRNIGIEVNFQDDNWEFESNFESLAERTYGDECNTNDCSTKYLKTFSRIYNKIEVSGLSGISGTYIGEFIGGDEENCIDPQIKIEVPDFYATGTYTYIRTISYDVEYFGECNGQQPYSYTCSETIPIIVQVSFKGGLFTSGGTPILNNNLADDSFIFKPFIQIAGRLQRRPFFIPGAAFGDNCSLFTLYDYPFDIECRDMPFDFENSLSDSYYPYFGIISSNLFNTDNIQDGCENYACPQGFIDTPFIASAPSRSCHSVIPQNSVSSNIITELSCNGSRVINYPDICSFPPDINQTWNYHHTGLGNATANFFYI